MDDRTVVVERSSGCEGLQTFRQLSQMDARCPIWTRSVHSNWSLSVVRNVAATTSPTSPARVFSLIDVKRSLRAKPGFVKRLPTAIAGNVIDAELTCGVE
jgi:hypothetical protein